MSDSQLTRWHEQLVRRVRRRRSGARSATSDQDLVQETYLRVLARGVPARTGDDARDAKTLRRLLHWQLEFVILDDARRHGVERARGNRHSAPPPHEATSSDTTPTQRAVGNELVDRLRADLDTRERTAIDLFAWRGHRAADVGDRLAMSGGAVRSLMRRLRARLQR